MKVIVPLFNPSSLKVKLASEFIKRIMAQDVYAEDILVIEASNTGDFLLRSHIPISNYIPLDFSDIYWLRPQLVNIGAELSDSINIAWIDPDILFTNPNWYKDADKALENYPLVHLFSEARDLDKHNSVQDPEVGVGWAYTNMPTKVGKPYPYGAHCGYAWAARRGEFLAAGGLFENALVGGDDFLMAMCQKGSILSCFTGEESFEYTEAANEYFNRFKDSINKVGYIAGTVLHYWHGDKKNRKYIERTKILADFKYRIKRPKLYNSGIANKSFIGNYPILAQLPQTEIVEKLYDYFQGRISSEIIDM